MRKAVIQIGKYEVREAPNGGWRIFIGAALGQDPISIHETKAGAIALATELHTAFQLLKQ